MKKIMIFIAIVGAMCYKAHAQNLVRNPGFENTNSCAYAFLYDLIDTSNTYFPGVQDWYRPCHGSTDYYNTCNPYLFSLLSPLPSPRTGEAYMRMYPEVPLSQNKEFASSKLLIPLENTCYFVGFYVRNTNDFSYTFTDAIGVHLSVNKLNYFVPIGTIDTDSIPIFPPSQITNPAGRWIREKWIEVSGIYQAVGGEQYITIGNFKPTIASVSPIFGVIYETVTYFVPIDSLHYNNEKCQLVDDVSVIAASDYLKMQVADTLICDGATVTYQIATNYTDILWSTGATDSSITIPISGTYWVGADYGCGWVYDTFTVQTYSADLFKLPNDTSVCPMSNFIITAPLGYTTYSWSNGSTNASITTVGGGLYSCTATSNCGTYIDTIVVSNTSIPFALSLPPDSVPCGSINTTITATLGYDSYLWNNGSTSASINITDYGTYWVQASHACGTETDTIRFINGATSALSLPPTLVFCNDDLPYNLTANNGFDTYSWNTGANTQNILITSTGVYICTAINACQTIIDTTVVTIISVPAITPFTDTMVCSALSFNIYANAGTGFDTYNWSNGASTQSININTTGTYSVTATHACGSQSQSFIIDNYPSPALSIGKDTSLCSSQLPFSLTATPGFDTYLWSNTSTSQNIDITQSGTYIVAASDLCGVQRDTVFIKVIISDFESFNLGADTTLCTPDGYEQTQILKVPRDYDTYSWNDGATTYYNLVNTPGIYSVTATNSCGSVADSILVSTCPPDDTYDLFIPNAFTPNDDGLNDVWSLQFRNILINRASVYDRWGNKVFECMDCGNVDWDGTYKSKPIHGVFNYIIDAEVLESSRKIVKKGNITVI
jgi:gliding motility-associated-like protein